MNDKAKPTITSRISALAIILFGNPDSVILETRAFNATLFLVFCAGIVAEIDNVLSQSTLTMHLITFSALLVSVGAYLASRKMKIWKSLVLPVYLLFLFILSYGWIIEGGLSGGIVFYFFLLTCAAIIVFQGIYKMVALLLVCTFVTILILIETTHPNVITLYASNSQRYISVSVSLIICLLTNGSMTYIVFREYLRERNAKNVLLESVLREKNATENALLAKQRLLSMISHDIANALMIIDGNASLMRREKIVEKEQIKNQINGIATGVMNIREIIESVRTLQAVEEGVATLQLKQVHLEQMVSSVKFLVADRLKQKDITFDIQLPDSGPITFLAEPRMFCNHVLSNLLSNAIKFSYPGSSIVIRAEVNNGISTVEVVDKGIGIPRGIMDRLFQTGEKTTRKGTNQESGTGLGLLVVKSFVELFGGTIEVLSRPEEEFRDDHGTTVTLRLKAA